MSYHCEHIRRAKIKDSDNFNAGESAEKLDHSYTTGRNVISILENSLSVPFKTKNEFAVQLNN